MSKTPKLCKQGNLAYVRIRGRKIYLGIHSTPEAQREYHRVIAEYHANASAPPRDKKSITLRINHSKKFAQQKNHINGIENFWNQAKRHLRKFNGVPKNKFNLFLKECEFRFNYGSPKQLLTTLKKWIKIYQKEGMKEKSSMPAPRIFNTVCYWCGSSAPPIVCNSRFGVRGPDCRYSRAVGG